MEAFETELIDEASDELPHRVEGWMNVLDAGYSSDRSVLLKSKCSWASKYCVLLTMGHHFSQFSTQKEAEITRSNGEQTTVIIGDRSEDERSIKSLSSQQKPAARSLSRKEKKSQRADDSGYEKSLLKDRRGSVPVIVPRSPTCESPDPLTSSNRLMSFISRKSSQLKNNLKRAKSATKLETKKSDGIVVANGDAGTSSPQTLTTSLKRTMSLSRLSRRWHGRSRPGQERSDAVGDGEHGGGSEGQCQVGTNIRASHSHESLFTLPPNTQSFDLSMPYIQIKPLHSSVCGEEHCFQVSTTNSTKLFSCRTAFERQKWMQHLQKTVQPFHEQTRRTDLSLELWIMEAKNLPPKHKYFCEIYLDNILHARSSSKVNGSLLFWGEQFDLGNLPYFKMLIIKLFKEGNRSKRKEANILIGQVEVLAEKINVRQLTDSKYPVVSRLIKDATLRLKARYQCIEILPMSVYQPLLEYVQKDYRFLVTLLESNLAHVKEKEDMAHALVRVMQKLGCAREFLVNILVDEITHNRQDSPEVFLRGNSVASKAIDVYMKLVGEKYLHDTLSDFIKMVLESPHSFEVDPQLVTNNADLQTQKKHLLKFCQRVWYKIYNSHSSVPVELKVVFSDLKADLLLKTNGNEDLSRQLISSCLFLRFLCPAVLSPSMFGIVQVFPQDRDLRNLTLISKTIQKLANFTKFGGGKEDFMVFLNEFVEMETTNLKTFLDQISTVDPYPDNPAEESCFVDLGREVSTLHSLLQESFNSVTEKATEEQRNRLNILAEILSEISDVKNDASHPKTQRASASVQRNGCNSVCTTPKTLFLPPLDGKVAGNGSAKGDSCSPAVMPRFVSNTSFKLTNSTSSTSSEPSGSFFSIPRARNTMREMQDSDQYISFTSEKALPALPPVTSASVLFGNRVHERPPLASPSGNHVVFAAETSSNDFTTDVLSMIDSVINNMSGSRETVSLSHNQNQLWNQKGSSCSLTKQGASGTSAVSRQQPLAFSNPLFSYQCAAKSSHTTSSHTSPSGTPVNHTPPIVSSGCSLPSESEKLFTMGSMNGSREPIMHMTSAACARNTSPSPSLGHPPVQRTGLLYGCHSHENLPHHRGLASASVHPPSRNSAAMAASDLDTYFAMATGGVLSRSMEFPLPPQQPIGPENLLKRNNTDSLIVVPRGAGIVGLDTPPESPTCCTTGYPTVRRNGQPQSTVRMGVRSVQRKLQENEKGKLEYELELRHLRQQLTESRRKLEQEKAAAVAQVQTECQKFRQAEEQYRQKLADKDKEITNLKERLLSSELHGQRSEALIRDLQLQVKELAASLGGSGGSGQRARVLPPTHNQAIDGRQCSTH